MDDRTLDNLPIEDFLHRIFDRLDDIRININSSQQAILDLTEQNNTLMKEPYISDIERQRTSKYHLYLVLDDMGLIPCFCYLYPEYYDDLLNFLTNKINQDTYENS